MSVIGFDIGNENCVIAAAKRGGVDVLLNDEAKRETFSVVSFGEKQRFLGSAGAALASANSKATIAQIKRLVGKVYKEVEEELKLLPFATSEGPRGGILIELEYLKKKWTFTPVEILAMLFKHLKEIAEKSLDHSAVVDCVIGIPSYYTDLQRRLYLDAAKIAGLKPLRLLHDGTAIALGYGMYKTDLSESGPTNVMFVDIGHCDTQVTVAAFEQGGMRILSHCFDQNLGGRDFDEVLFQYFANQFNEKYKINIHENARASIRLRASCEKVKKVLSANAEAPLSIECLIGDTDVKGNITREEFEKLSSKLLERVINPCDMALKDSRLSIDKIYTIELVGSGSRVPAITRIITSSFKKEPTRTLNASECVARGCALRCAMLSPTLKVRDYEIKDAFPYTILIPSPQAKLQLFPKGGPFPNEKMMNHIGNTSSFYFQVAYIKDRDFPAGVSNIVGHFSIGSSEPSAEKADVDFTMKLNYNGIVELDSAKMSGNERPSGRNIMLKMLLAYNDVVDLETSENLDLATTDDELREASMKENILADQDIKVEKTKDQRNTLESFVYDTRSKLSGAYRSYATDSEKEIIINSLQKTEDWLYEDSDDEESEEDYTGKLKDLKKLLEPIENKYHEEIALAKATKALQSCIAKYRSHADSLPADKKEKLKDQCMVAEKWLNNLSQDESSQKILSTRINRAIDIFDGKCKTIITSKSSTEIAMEKAAKPLQACIAEYYLLAESLQPVKKEKVKNVCREVEQWFANFVSQKNLPLKTLSAGVNHAIKSIEKDCNSIISESSFSWHEEHDVSDQRRHRAELEESKNSRRKATKALQACIAEYCSGAESLPADKKEQVKDFCMRAEQWLNKSQSRSSSNTLTAEINQVIEDVERHCNNIISSEPSLPRHEEPEGSGPRKQPVEFDKKEQQRVVSENVRTKATKSLQACIAQYRSRAESRPTDIKDKVEKVCKNAEEWFVSQKQSSKSFSTDIKQLIGIVERECESILSSQSPSTHQEPVDVVQTVQPVELDQHMDSENPRTIPIKYLQDCIVKHLSRAESLPADSKDKVKDLCMRAEQCLGSLSQSHSSPNSIDNIIQHLESTCETIYRSNPSFSKHEEREDSDQTGQTVGADKTGQPVNSEHVESMDEDKTEDSMDVDKTGVAEQRAPDGDIYDHQ